MANKLTLANLRKIISEEISNINEEVDLAAENDVFNTAGKLLMAIGAFKENANPNMVSAISADLEDLETHLKNMRSAPSQYVVSTNEKSVKTVSLKPVKKDRVM